MYIATEHVLDIRRADHTDIPVISILAHAIWPETYGGILNEAQIHHMLDLFYSHESLKKQFDEHHVFLLALMNAETVGFASYSHANTAGAFKVHKLYVHPMLHGKGFGKKLLDRISRLVLPPAWPVRPSPATRPIGRLASHRARTCSTCTPSKATPAARA